MRALFSEVLILSCNDFRWKWRIKCLHLGVRNRVNRFPSKCIPWTLNWSSIWRLVVRTEFDVLNSCSNERSCVSHGSAFFFSGGRQGETYLTWCAEQLVSERLGTLDCSMKTRKDLFLGLNWIRKVPSAIFVVSLTILQVSLFLNVVLVFQFKIRGSHSSLQLLSCSLASSTQRMWLKN